MVIAVIGKSKANPRLLLHKTETKLVLLALIVCECAVKVFSCPFGGMRAGECAGLSSFWRVFFEDVAFEGDVEVFAFFEYNNIQWNRLRIRTANRFPSLRQNRQSCP